jgi:hypothetical protein
MNSVKDRWSRTGLEPEGMGVAQSEEDGMSKAPVHSVEAVPDPR